MYVPVNGDSTVHPTYRIHDILRLFKNNEGSLRWKEFHRLEARNVSRLTQK